MDDRVVEDFKWTVKHRSFKSVEVVATDKLRAIQAAAKIWKTPWSPIARECMVKRGKLVRRRVIMPARSNSDEGGKRHDK